MRAEMEGKKFLSWFSIPTSMSGRKLKVRDARI